MSSNTVNTWAGFVSMLPLFSALLLMRIVIDSSLSLLLIDLCQCMLQIFKLTLKLSYVKLCLSN
ncbi:unnamed protein product, partial [Brassica rapa subsp. narinosa]